MITKLIKNKKNVFLAIASGLLLTASFPKIEIHWLAWFCLVPFLFALKDLQPAAGFRIGFITGLFHFLSLLYWVVPVMRTYGYLPGYLAVSVLVLFAAVQVAQRALNYGLLGPVKEMLFTVVDRETKYKSKNFIDTVVYRGSDVTASWIFKGLMMAGLSIGQVAWVYIPILTIWGITAWHLGKTYTRLKDQLDMTISEVE